MEIGEGRRIGRSSFIGTLPDAAQPGESVATAHAGTQKYQDSRRYGENDLRFSTRGGVHVQPDFGLSNRLLNKPGAWLTVMPWQGLAEHPCCFFITFGDALRKTKSWEINSLCRHLGFLRVTRYQNCLF